MEQFLIDSCELCSHRNGLLCNISHRDCKPHLEPCPFEEEGLYPCKYPANDNVKRFLESLDIKVVLSDTSTTEEDIKEARRVVEECIEENVQKAKESIASVSEKFKVDEDDKFHDEFIVKKQSPVNYNFNSKRRPWLKIKKLFKKH